MVDSRYAGRDAGEVIDGKAGGIPVVESIETAMQTAEKAGTPATHLVVGIAPDGGRLGKSARQDVIRAIDLKLNVDCGLHDFLSEDEAISRQADMRGVVLRDIRKPPSRDRLHFFSGKIEDVAALKIAVLGTDSAVGKRTTAWLMVQAFERLGYRTQMIGTGQTAWMQGARYSALSWTPWSTILFPGRSNMPSGVPGTISQTRRAGDRRAGQSDESRRIPAGFEILAAGRPDVVILQHAPGAAGNMTASPAIPSSPCPGRSRPLKPSRGSRSLPLP